jgi:hypothetical protein
MPRNPRESNEGALILRPEDPHEMAGIGLSASPPTPKTSSVPAIERGRGITLLTAKSSPLWFGRRCSWDAPSSRSTTAKSRL